MSQHALPRPGMFFLRDFHQHLDGSVLFSWEAMDAELENAIPPPGGDNRVSADSLEAAYGLIRETINVPELPEPDLAGIAALTGVATSFRCSWGGRWGGFVRGDDGQPMGDAPSWMIACEDEIRGTWLPGFEAPTLEGALAQAVAWVTENADWLTKARRGWEPIAATSALA